MSDPAEQSDTPRGLVARFCGEWRALGFLLGFACTAYYAYLALMGSNYPAAERSLFIFFALSLTFCLYPLARNVPARLLDVALLALAAAGTLRFLTMYRTFAFNVGLPISDLDMVIGWIYVALCLEAARRVLGLAIPVIGIVFLAFLFAGPYIPAPLGHAGFDARTIAANLYAGTSGIFGSITYVLAANMFLFLVFGAFLIRSGASEFFTNLCLAAFGHHAGGGAKAAVGASCMTASISGSATANVAITGSLTIPLMQRTGFQPHVAGGVEAAASTGGTVMPPIMGTVAFIMVALTSIPYSQIALYSLIPALLFFLSVFMQVHFYARRRGLAGIPDNERPDLRRVLRDGWFFFLPIVMVIALIFMDYSLRRIGLLAIASVIVVSWLTPGRGMGPRAIVETMAEGAKTALPILAVAAPVSIIAAAILLPGTGLRITGLIIGMAGGDLLLTLMFVMAAAYVMGMGLAVLPAYIILATLVAPALIMLGVPVFAAHLLVIWWSQTSNVTPPVALAAYMAAAIAKTSAWKTGNAAVVKAAAMFYIPILFVYQPAILLNGDIITIIVAIGSIILGTAALSAAIEGFFYTPLGLAKRAFFALAGVLLMLGHDLASVAPGLLLLAALWVMQKPAAFETLMQRRHR